MEFSVIIPTYQEEACIERCLRSIVQQDIGRTKFEIIVSDAHSADRTAEIARRYADRVLVDEKRGIAYGRNAGAKTAGGDILVFVDADATLAPDFLSQLSMTFITPAVIGATGIAKPSDGKFMPRFFYYGTYILVRFFAFWGLSLFPGICAAYRRPNFIAVNGFREDFGIVEDLDLSRRISRTGICRINKNALAFISTRRLQNHLVSTVAFHIYSDIKYLLTGKAAPHYPKIEEMKTWKDLWQQ
ncbi:MAG: glycosyltransferase family 2 protein [Ignavibacteriae bacterium]|nr:MAG: glycosyltransferase family 2 protein [Ignavibacteriota bacterium]